MTEIREPPDLLCAHFAVFGAGFVGGIVSTGIYSVLFLDFVTILHSDLLIVVGCALAFGLVGMLPGAIVGLSTKLVLKRVTAFNISWLAAIAVSFVIGSYFALVFLRWLI